MIGVEDTHGAKMPIPMSSVKAIPLEEPDCFREVCQHLAKEPPHPLGRQVLLQHVVSFQGIMF